MKSHRGPPPEPRKSSPAERSAEGKRLMAEMLHADTSDRRRRQIAKILLPKV